MGKQSKGGEVIEGYCRRYPKIPNARLARKIRHEEPTLGTQESILTSIRYYRGQNGGAHRKARERAGKVELFKESASPNVYEIPEPREMTREPFVLPKACRKLLVLSDIHVPYHDLGATRLAIEYGKSVGVDSVLLNGDVMDMYGPSSHDPDPRNMDLPGEVNDTKQFLAYLRNEFDGCPIYYKEGNHEDRLERYMIKHAPVLLGVEEFELRNILGLGSLGIEWIGNKRLFLAGKLVIIHGHEYKGGGGVNPARWLSLRTSGSLMCGHFHRSSSHLSKSILGEVTGAWSTGCLCHMSPDYSPYNQWNVGFAVVSVNPDGTFEVDNKIIIDGLVR